MEYGLEAVNDVYIEQLVADPNFKINDEGVISTCISKQGHITNVWRLKEVGTKRVGYRHISYFKKKLSVHRIMYRLFYGTLSADMVINHKDGNPGNNIKDNLELVPQGDNNTHSYKVLGRLPSSGNAKYSQAVVDGARKMRNEGATYREIMKVYGMCKSSLSYIINSKTWNKETTKYTPQL